MIGSMKAAVLERPGEIRLVERALPSERGPGEACGRVRRAAVCGTDYHAFRGNQPFFEYPRIGARIERGGIERERRRRGLPGRATAARSSPYLNAATAAHASAARGIAVLTFKCRGVQRQLIPASGWPICEALPPEPLRRSHVPLRRSRASATPGEHALSIGMGPIGVSVADFALLGSGDHRG